MPREDYSRSHELVHNKIKYINIFTIFQYFMVFSTFLKFCRKITKINPPPQKTIFIIYLVYMESLQLKLQYFSKKIVFFSLVLKKINLFG